MARTVFALVCGNPFDMEYDLHHQHRQDELANIVLSAFQTYGMLTVEELYGLLHLERHKVLIGLTRLCTSGRIKSIKTEAHHFFAVPNYEWKQEAMADVQQEIR